MLKNIYPIGTKVKIKKEENELLVMIIGRIDKIDEDSFHDYIGMYYPIGFTEFEKLLNFQEEDIIKVIELGYVDEFESELCQQLKEAMLIM